MSSPKARSRARSGQKSSIAGDLIAWYRDAKRDLPWRRTRDPWRILVSEVMLQQTRVAAVIPYYERFLDRFPTAESLAVAPEQELLALWSGLGYYSRARNLQAAARQIAERGGFPETLDEIRALKGVGPYTAAAVASICFDVPAAVLDGNVMRVAARLTADPGDIGSTITRKRLQAFADRELPRSQAAEFNQAIMELGATLCVPRTPQCLLCPVSGNCEARRAGTQNHLPVKLRKTAALEEERTVLVIRRNDAILMWQRPADSARLAGFWELPEGEQLPGARVGPELGVVRHAIVNHSYTIRVKTAQLPRPPRSFSWVERGRMREIPVSTIARKALDLVFGVS